MKGALASVVTDTSLTPGACRLVLYVATLGEGKHEIAHMRFAALLNHPGDKSLRSDLRVAEELGYLKRTPGGRGHHDRYALSPPLSATLSDSPAPQEVPYPLSPAPRGIPYKDSPAPTGTLSDRVAPQEVPYRIGWHPRGQPIHLDRHPGAPYGGGKGGAAVEEKMLQKQLEGARASATLDPKADSAIEGYGEKLAGCRGALRDYLTLRVPQPRQHAYVQKIAGWLDGLDPSIFRRPDGTTLPTDGRTGLLADALNDLAASEEGRMKRPVGDPANLRTKLSVLLAQRCDRQRRASAQGGEPDDLPAGDRQLLAMRARMEDGSRLEEVR